MRKHLPAWVVTGVFKKDEEEFILPDKKTKENCLQLSDWFNSVYKGPSLTDTLSVSIRALLSEHHPGRQLGFHLVHRFPSSWPEISSGVLTKVPAPTCTQGQGRERVQAVLVPSIEKSLRSSPHECLWVSPGLCFCLTFPPLQEGKGGGARETVWGWHESFF